MLEDSVGNLSLIVAAKRALETERADRLFDDPFAALLAGDELTAMKERYQRLFGADFETGVSGRIRFVALRTRFYDDFLYFAHANVRQIVILGAGMDARAFRLPWLPDTQIYEIDRGAVMQRKNALLAAVKPKSRRCAIAIDLCQDWKHALLDRGYCSSSPSIWLLEGLLMYLDETEAQRTVQTISELSSPGSFLGADLISQQSLQAALKSGDRVRCHWRFGTDEPEKLFAVWGWNTAVIRPREVGAWFGRFSLATSPSGLKSGRRSFLLTAYKPEEGL